MWKSIGMTSMALGAAIACSAQNSAPDSVDPDLKNALDRVFEQRHARAHNRTVEVGSRAIALARLVRARREAVDPARAVFDSELGLLWAASCVPFGAEAAPFLLALRTQYLTVLERLPTDLEMLDCHHAFLGDRGASVLVYGKDGWQLSPW